MISCRDIDIFTLNDDGTIMRIAADGRGLLPEEPGVSSGLRLSLSRAGMAAATLGKYAIFAEAGDGNRRYTVDIFKEWSNY